MMFFKLVLFFLLLGGFVASEQEDLSFTFNGFQGVNLSLDGLAQIADNGLLTLANTTLEQISRAFYPHPVHFKNSSKATAFSFSTTFIFAMTSELTTIGGPGIMFVITPSRDFPGALPGYYLGLFNTTNIGKPSNHVIGIELDCLQNKEFNDIDGNHIGIDINDLNSVKSATASYFSDQENRYVNLSLISGDRMQLWVEYDGSKKQLNVTLAPINVPRPTIPLLSLNIDLSQTLVDPMFMGFSSSTSAVEVSHYVLGWSFKMNGQAKPLSLSHLPKLPRRGPKVRSPIFSVGLPVIVVALVLISVFIIKFVVKRKNKFAEVLEDWEIDYRSHRFKYKDLYMATKGFEDDELLGTGGFGSVYRGVLPTSKKIVAVKRISHDSKQGEKEFIAEIVSIGRMRHRNIVALLGYCRRKGELLLVYDYMPNGSLDKFLFDKSTTRMTLNWNRRFQVIKGVASALLYLHEEWEQVVVHRDVKSSNVLLDEELNGRLGDFGLARLYNHGSDPKSTHVVGTFGYLAPELYRTGKVNSSVDVFAFGVFLLEVACGRRPLGQEAAAEEGPMLVDWVISSWSRGSILETADPKLGMDYKVDEMELVLKLGLLCSHSVPTARPRMRQVVRYLEGEVPLPKFTSLYQSMCTDDFSFGPSEGSTDVSAWYASIGRSSMTGSSSVAESILSGGR